MPYGSKVHSLSKRLRLIPTILDRRIENNVKTLPLFSTFKYYEQQTPLPLQAMLVQPGGGGGGEATLLFST